jgi:hypothetical protein
MSTKILAALFALAVGASLLGCRTPHLGDDTGKSYRKAMAAQTDHAAEATGPALSADDARAVVTVHRSGAKPTTGGSTPSGGMTTTTSTSSSSSGGAAWPGATGPISLEAK